MFPSRDMSFIAKRLATKMNMSYHIVEMILMELIQDLKASAVEGERIIIPSVTSIEVIIGEYTGEEVVKKNINQRGYKIATKNNLNVNMVCKVLHHFVEDLKQSVLQGGRIVIPCITTIDVMVNESVMDVQTRGRVKPSLKGYVAEERTKQGCHLPIQIRGRVSSSLRTYILEERAETVLA